MVTRSTTSRVTRPTTSAVTGNGVSGGSGGWTTPTFADDFNRPDGAIGADWAVVFGSGWSVASGKASRSGAANWEVTRTTTRLGLDQVVEAELSSATTAGGIAFRINPETNVFLAAHYNTSGTLFLSRFAGSASGRSTLGSAAGVISLPCTIRAVASGSSIQVYVNDVLKINATNTSVPTGDYAGLVVFGAVTMDNFSATGSDVFSDTIQTSSSIDAISPIESYLYFDPTSESTMPLVAVMHGFGQTAGDFVFATRKRFASYGTGALFVNMRGRGSAPGSPDASGRELYDIKDAIENAVALYPAKFSFDNIHIIGYSGGGGNALGVACKFPGLCGVVTSFFGMSDYGFDTTDGWWYTSPTYRTQLNSWIGDRTVSDVPYKARSSFLAISNFAGRLRLYHDTGDAEVPVVNSTNVASAFPSAVVDISEGSDSVRWLHGLPGASGPLLTAEPDIFADMFSGSYPGNSLGGNQSFVIVGYVVVDGWEVWLGDGTADFGSVDYVDGATPSFTITSDQSEPWTVKIKGLTPSSSKTIEVNTVEYTETAGADGVAVFVQP